MSKDGYKPTSGMQSAARRAIKLKEQGKAKGAGTAVGWTRAGQLARGETLSLSTVKRMYSFFSRHEVDKQGKDWDNAESPSNGKIMWLAWGGDAGFSWSRKITQREKTMKKNLELNEMVEEIKDMLDDVVNPITKSIEIEDDMEKAKDAPDLLKYDQKTYDTARTALANLISIEANGVAEDGDKKDVALSHLLSAVHHLLAWYEGENAEGGVMEVTEDTIEMSAHTEKGTTDCKCDGCMECKAAGGCDMGVCKMHKGMYKAEELSDEDISKNYESDNQEEDNWDNMQKACWSGYKQVGMKDKGGKKVPNCVPVKKSLFGTEGPQTLIPGNK